MDEGRRRQPMLRHDAIRRALGATWVIIFLTTLLLPIGVASGAGRPFLDANDVGGAQQPIVDAQAADPTTLESATEPPAAPVAAPPAAPNNDPSAQAALASQATVDVRQSKIEASSPGSDAWDEAQTGRVVTEGFRLRTDASGSGRLVYFEGSST